MAQYSMRDALKQFLNNSRLKGQLQALRVEDVWESVMGKTISKYTEKIQVINGTLYITTHVAPLKHELNFQKENIRQRINEAIGEPVVREVVIK